MEQQTELKRNIGTGTAMATVVGSVIGSGVFFKPQAMYTATGGAPGLAMFAWIFTGVVCICAAMTFAEIAILIPKTGGMVTYLEAAFGKTAGYLCGWMQTILFYPAMVAALAVAFANQATLFIGDRFRIPVALGAILLLMVLNTMGSAVGGAVQNIFTVAKLIPLVLLMIFGLLRGESGSAVFQPMLADGLHPGVVLGQLMVAVLFAFEGWTNVGAIAGEMKRPGKDLPVAIVGGVFLIMAVYVVVNIAYLRVLPAEQLMNLDAPASAVAIALFGKAGGKFISVGIMISVFGACNGFVLSGSRVAYSLALENTLPASGVLAKVNRSQVPVNSILLIGGLGCLYALSGQFNMLTDLAVFSSWIFYTLTFAAVIQYRRLRPDLERAYRVPLYPVIPLIAIVSGIYVILNQLLLSGSSARILALGSITLTLLGLPVRHLTHRSRY